MRPLDRFHVQVEGAGSGVCADGSIAAIGQGAGLPVAQPSDIVFIAAEGLLLRCPVAVSFEDILPCKGPYLSLKEQNCWFMTCQTISSDDMVNDQPDFVNRKDRGVCIESLRGSGGLRRAEN